MSYYLSNSEPGGDGRGFRVSTAYWPRFLKLAEEFGWKPQGTEYVVWRCAETSQSEIEEMERNKQSWDGSYCSNDEQIVCKDDAANIAIALERALRYMAMACGVSPESITPSDSVHDRDSSETPTMVPQYSVGSELTNCRLFNRDIWTLGIRLDRIKELIDFCRQGAFIIN